MWHRWLHADTDTPRPPQAVRLERDPDLDALHHEQHNLMNQSGYAAQKIRDSWNEHVRRSWEQRA